MPHYIRSRVEGGTYFFTVVTYHRLPILTRENSREILRAAWLDAENRFPFETLAIWQRRFWEHTIADENDYEFHLDYIHYNPIKHG
jgi:putative transposase